MEGRAMLGVSEVSMPPESLHWDLLPLATPRSSLRHRQKALFIEAERTSRRRRAEAAEGKACWSSLSSSSPRGFSPSHRFSTKNPTEPRAGEEDADASRATPSSSSSSSPSGSPLSTVGGGEEGYPLWRRHIVAGKKYRWLRPPTWVLSLLEKATAPSVSTPRRSASLDSKRALAAAGLHRSSSSNIASRQWLLKLCDWNEAAFYFWVYADAAAMDSSRTLFGRKDDVDLERMLSLLLQTRGGGVSAGMDARDKTEKRKHSGGDLREERTDKHEEDSLAPAAAPFPAVLLEEAAEGFWGCCSRVAGETRLEQVRSEIATFMPRCACVFWRHKWKPALPPATAEANADGFSFKASASFERAWECSSRARRENAAEEGLLPLGGGSFCCGVLLEDVCGCLGGACVMDLKMGKQMHSEACLDEEKIRRMQQKAASRSFESHGFAVCGVAAPSHSRPRTTHSPPMRTATSRRGFPPPQTEASNAPTGAENISPFSARPLLRAEDERADAKEERGERDGRFPPPREFHLSPGASYGLRSDSAFLEAFRRFFTVNGSEALGARLVQRCLEKLARVESFFRRQKVLAFHGASLLLVFDADPPPPAPAPSNGARSCWNAEEAVVASLEIVWVDFAHVSLVRRPARDEGFLFGIRNIKRLLTRLLEDLLRAPAAQPEGEALSGRTSFLAAADRRSVGR